MTQPRERPIACADLATLYRARDVVVSWATAVPVVLTGQNAAPAHCDGGVGHDTVDWLTPLVDWVERRIEPHAIAGSRGTSTRPRCPYPQQAAYDGVGDSNVASSFSCKKLD